MLMLDCSSESGSFSNLLEAGNGVNAPADAFGQSPAHLAACGGEAFFPTLATTDRRKFEPTGLPWRSPNSQSSKSWEFGMPCSPLLLVMLKLTCATTVDKQAADLALAYGFLECAKFLTTVQHTQTMKLRGQSACSLSDKCAC
ncbi:ankyrin repeat domain-containing protein 37 [Calypte anna]|uniref:ankyrin repeat domain-containing protein 37 n=1 Tax=Calypte anna TaxID=9244 RepID=UPI0011C40E95|nr:ankyrin repeat domain-containing protein 37 [Calypte anna]